MSGQERWGRPRAERGGRPADSRTTPPSAEADRMPGAHTQTQADVGPDRLPSPLPAADAAPPPQEPEGAGPAQSDQDMSWTRDKEILKQATRKFMPRKNCF